MEEQQFAQWLDGYKLAWEEGDAKKLEDLFSFDAIYEETPFDKPLRGQEAICEYWRAGARDAQRSVTFSYQIYSVIDNIGICRWHCFFERTSSGQLVELDGIFRCEFMANGKCTRYSVAFTSLKDKEQDAVLYVSGTAWCGSGGYALIVLRPRTPRANVASVPQHQQRTVESLSREEGQETKEHARSPVWNAKLQIFEMPI